MSGELDERPDLTALLRNLRDRVYELEHRVSGDTNPLSLGDLDDVRVDSLGDVTITLADGDALVYRAADELWVPGSGGGLTWPIVHDDTETTVTLSHTSGRLTIKNVLDAGSVLLSQLILDDDGTAYLEAYGGEVVVYSSVDSARIQSGASTYVWAYEDGSLSETFMAVNGAGSPLSVGLDDGTWSRPTFYTLAGTDAQNIWDGMVSATTSGDLDPSQFGFWLDDTPGSTSINFKAKDSGGTVRTGSVALT